MSGSASAETERGAFAQAALRLAPGLSGCEGEVISQILDFFELRTVEKDAQICEKGTPSDRLWIVVTASVAAQLSPHRVTPCFPTGTLIGHLGVITGEPRGTTFVITEPGLILELPARTLHRVLRQTGPDAFALRRLLIVAMGRQIESLDGAVLDAAGPDSPHAVRAILDVAIARGENQA